jgi:hypothetical protein
MPHLDWHALWNTIAHPDWQALWSNLLLFGAPDSAKHPVSLVEKVVRPVLVYLLLVALLRRAGKRVLAQLNPFDLVVLLTLSNTVQNAIIGNDTSLLGGAAPLQGGSRHLPDLGRQGPGGRDAPAAHQRG